MSWSYLQEQAEAYLGGSCLAGNASEPSKKTTTADVCCSNGNAMESLNHSPFGMICEPSPSVITTSARSSRRFAKWLIGLSSKQASPASRSALQESDKEPTTTATAGPGQSDPFVIYDPLTHSWKTFQACLLPGILTPSSVTWPRAGMMHDGECYRRPSWERRISVIGSGLSHIPTPRSREIGDYQYDRGDHSKPRPTLTGWVKMFPTPTAIDAGTGRFNRSASPNAAERPTLAMMARTGLWPTPNVRGMDGGSHSRKAAKERGTFVTHSGGQLNPTFCEWLMGWPIGWTDLKPLAMDKYQRWLQQHGVCCGHRK